MANQMRVKVETGEEKTINVYDILPSFAFDKEFIIYSFVDSPEELYASILNETEKSVSFDPITDPNEIQYITAEVRRVANEIVKSK